MRLTRAIYPAPYCEELMPRKAGKVVYFWIFISQKHLLQLSAANDHRAGRHEADDP